MIDRQDITGLVLAGGRGSRMGGVDKGLQLHAGRPLAQHALQRLAPQVGPVMLNANRNAEAYAAMGAPVVPDSLPDYPGPLAGFLAGLDRCTTPWLVSVPCDSPLFPADLVARLAGAASSAHADIAIAATLEDGETRLQPVFCLMRTSLAADLRRYLENGERRIERWTARHPRAIATFEDPAPFANANTLAELQALRPHD